MSTPDRRNLRFGLKPRSSPADNYLMTTQSKSQAENLWDQAENLIAESLQALTDLSRSTK